MNEELLKAKALIQAEKDKIEKDCAEEIKAVLSKYACKLSCRPEVTIGGKSVYIVIEAM